MLKTNDHPGRFRALGWISGTGLLIGVIGLGLAAVAAAEDLADRTDDWDGFGLIIAAYIAVPALVVTLLAILGLWKVRRRSQAAPRTALDRGAGHT